MGTHIVPEQDLPLQLAYRWEKERANEIFLTQPMGGGKVRDWTWAQAIGETRRIAAHLRAQPWPPGSRIAILAKNCAWWMMADLAIWMSGHVSVPIYPSLKPKTVRQILEHSDAVACFVGGTDDREAPVAGIPEHVRCIRFPTAANGSHPLWDSLLDQHDPIPGAPTRPEDDLATIIYTSGTTGVPKGVMHRFTAIAFAARALVTRTNATSAARSLSYLPLAHIVERVGLFGPALMLGSRVYFTEGLETFLADLRRASPTIFLTVPRLLLKFQHGVFASIPKHKLDRLMRIPIVKAYLRRRILRQLGLDTVEFLACGAAPLPTDIMLWYRNLGIELAEGYGLTEGLITHLPFPGRVRPGYVGCALDGVETKVGPGGELLIKSPMNLIGYYKDPQGTKDVLTEDGFLRTGDVVHMDGDGQIKIVGRIKEQFKTSKGKYVAPAPIESMLNEHPAVEACCLLGSGMPSPFAVVLLAPDVKDKCLAPDVQRQIEESLRSQMEQVNSHLDPHERLSFLAVVDGPWNVENGLITPTLKIRRSALEDRYYEYFDQWKKQNNPVIWQREAQAGGAREKAKETAR